MRTIRLIVIVAMPLAACLEPPGRFAADRCATERGWVEAEATTPGVVQRLVGEALVACLAGEI